MYYNITYIVIHYLAIIGEQNEFLLLMNIFFHLLMNTLFTNKL